MTAFTDSLTTLVISSIVNSNYKTLIHYAPSIIDSHPAYTVHFTVLHCSLSSSDLLLVFYLAI